MARADRVRPPEHAALRNREHALTASGRVPAGPLPDGYLRLTTSSASTDDGRDARPAQRNDRGVFLGDRKFERAELPLVRFLGVVLRKWPKTEPRMPRTRRIAPMVLTPLMPASGEAESRVSVADAAQFTLCRYRGSNSDRFPMRRLVRSATRDLTSLARRRLLSLLRRYHLDRARRSARVPAPRRPVGA